VKNIIAGGDKSVVLEKAAKQQQQQQQNLSQECLTKYYLLDQNILHFLHTEWPHMQ